MSNDNNYNKFFDDMAKLTGDALGAIGGFKTETENFFRNKLESCLKNMNYVTREEFEVVKEMASKAREEQVLLQQKLAELEAKHSKKS